MALDLLALILLQVFKYFGNMELLSPFKKSICLIHTPILPYELAKKVVGEEEEVQEAVLCSFLTRHFSIAWWRSQVTQT